MNLSPDARPSGEPAEQLLIANCAGNGPADAPLPPDNGLRARFLWADDRYLHRIEVGAEPTIPVMQTVVRSPTLAWPDDPPLQQLSIETLGDQTVALGVGSAGTSHWSLSIEAIPGPAPALRYDLACRCKLPPEQLASRFEMLANNGQFVIEADDSVTVSGLSTGILQILPEPSIGPVRWCPSDEGRGMTIAADLGPSPQPGTLRWGFHIVWRPVK